MPHFSPMAAHPQPASASEAATPGPGHATFCCGVGAGFGGGALFEHAETKAEIATRHLRKVPVRDKLYFMISLQRAGG